MKRRLFDRDFFKMWFLMAGAFGIPWNILHLVIYWNEPIKRDISIFAIGLFIILALIGFKMRGNDDDSEGSGTQDDPPLYK